MSEISVANVIDASRQPTLLIGADERVRHQNKAMSDILGLDFTNRNYVTALRQPAVLAAVDTALSEHEMTQSRYQARLGGQDMTFHVTAQPIKESVLVSFEDRTANEATQTLRRDFVANVSHELRTPLTALLGFIETLRGPARDDPKARDRFLGIMGSEAARMKHLVDDLLSLSRVEETERQRPNTKVDLAELIGTTLETLAPLAQAAQVPLTRNFADDVPTIIGDHAQLQQVVTNLVSNAIKYGASPRGITVTVAAPRYEKVLQTHGIAVTVTDDGEGIADHHLGRLTERFYRVDSHRARQMGGTGLGLAIVKHIINRHRGRMYIESTLGQGTTVRILLPVSTS